MAKRPETEVTEQLQSLHEIEILVRRDGGSKRAQSSNCYIYKVPESLKKGNPEAYTPQLISIGPIHHGQEKLKPMEIQKEIYLGYFWERLSNISESSAKFLKYLDSVREKEESIRECYSENYPEINTTQFVHMILLDAVFIMELFLRELNRSNDKDDPWTKQLWLKKSIQRDLLLLENQLPIFLLQDLYDIVFPANNKGKHSNFLSFSYEYFAFCDPQKVSKETIKMEKELEQELVHFTDLIRYLHIPNDLYMKPIPPNDDPKTARKLKEAGISFEKVSNKCLLDIKFKTSCLNWFLCLGCFPCLNFFRARLQLPQLIVDDMTECVLRNLIALEQCHYPDDHYICNYALLLDGLIENEDDVDLLVEDEVIVNKLGSHKEMATLINNLGKNVVITFQYYPNEIDGMNKHYMCKWKRSMGKLSWVYFRDLWRSSSTIVGIVVFLFAIVNFFSSVGLAKTIKPFYGNCWFNINGSIWK